MKDITIYISFQLKIRIFSRNKIFRYSHLYKVKLNKLNGPICVRVKHVFKLNKGKMPATQNNKIRIAREPTVIG